jgi:hypothetical protein
VTGPGHVVQILCFWERKVHNFLSVSVTTLCLHLFILECLHYILPGCNIYDKWLPDTSNWFVSPIHWYSIDIQSIITEVHIQLLHTELYFDGCWLNTVVKYMDDMNQFLVTVANQFLSIKCVLWCLSFEEWSKKESLCTSTSFITLKSFHQVQHSGNHIITPCQSRYWEFTQINLIFWYIC